jgi:glycosyltransferase involved in cell wall biosynthesis
MRVGLIVPGFSADAEDWCIPALRDLIQRLATRVDAHVVALRYPYRTSRYELFGAQVTALGGGQRTSLASLGLWQRALALLATEHRRRRFDVLHAFWANETGALATLAGRLLGIPTLVSLAGGELVGLPDIRYGGQLAATERAKVRLALGLADMVTAGSCGLLERARHWLGDRPAERIQHVPLGVDVDRFYPDRSPSTDLPPCLVQVASLSQVKDQALLLRAAAHLRAVGQACPVELVGEGPLEAHLRALADALDISSLVHFRGPIPHDHVPAVYRRATLYVQTSRHEAQGMAVLEAAACGLPVVGTPVGVLPELAPLCGATVPPDDPGALARTIADLLADSSRRTAMGRAAQVRVEADFNLVHSAERFHQLYTGLEHQA